MNLRIPSRLRVSFLYGLLICALLCTFGGCSQTEVIVRTSEELAFGREAVEEMMNLIVQSASENVGNIERWKTSNAQIVPPEATIIVEADGSIPGNKRLLQAYYDEIYSAISIISSRVPVFFQDYRESSLVIDDPFMIIEGGNDAVTRYFAATVSSSLELWIEEQLRSEIGVQALSAWQRVVRNYNTYVLAKNQLLPADSSARLTIVDVSVQQTVMIALIRAFIDNMTTQEALLRTMAPAYDDARIMLFSSQ